MGVSVSFGAGFIPDVQRPQFYVAWSLATLSCSPLGKLFASNGFSIIPNEKTPFPLLRLRNMCLCTSFCLHGKAGSILLILWQTATSDEFHSHKNVAENRLPLKSPHARCMSVSVFASWAGGLKLEAVCLPRIWVTQLSSEAGGKQTSFIRKWGHRRGPSWLPALHTGREGGKDQVPRR